MARLHGTEENANNVSTALINAGERVAQNTGAAFLFMHHVGKEASRNRDKSMNSARGGSGLIAGARSSIRLIQVDAKDAADFGNVPAGVIEAGDLVEVIHNKLNDGKRAATFYLRRQELAFERFHPLADSPAATHDRLLGALFEWAARQPDAQFQKAAVDTAEDRKTVFAPHTVRDRNAALALIDRALDSGDLVEGPKIRKSKNHWLKFRADLQPAM
jgi:RecA-family ATPase